jgi:isopenicillin N synthase-like dioxygenase
MRSLEMSRNEGAALIVGNAIPLGEPLLPTFSRGGIVRVRLDPQSADILRGSEADLRAFFKHSARWKRQYAHPQLTSGWRPPKTPVTNGKPDLNDSLIRQCSGFPNDNDPKIRRFVDGMNAFTFIADGVTEQLDAEMVVKYGRPTPGQGMASFTQVNSYVHLRKLRQQKVHEDAVFKTAHSSFGVRGLEAVNPAVVRLPEHASGLADVDVDRFAPEDFIPVPAAVDELVILCGGLGTALTGGDIPPLYHQSVAGRELRRLGIRHRLAEMRFYNPDVNVGEIQLLNENAFNENFSLREQTLKNPQDYFQLSPNSVEL